MALSCTPPQNYMDLSKGHVRALQEGDLSSPKGIEACINASEALLQCMNVALRPGGDICRVCLCSVVLFILCVAIFNWPILSLDTDSGPPVCVCVCPGHEKLMAVKQQQQLFSELRDTFARRLTNHLNNVFVHQVTQRPWRLEHLDQ